MCPSCAHNRIVPHFFWLQETSSKIYGFQILSSANQAGLGTAFKQEQKEISSNHVPLSYDMCPRLRENEHGGQRPGGGINAYYIVKKSQVGPSRAVKEHTVQLKSGP